MRLCVLLFAAIQAAAGLREAGLRTIIKSMLADLQASEAVNLAAAQHAAAGSPDMTADVIARESLLCARFVQSEWQNQRVRVAPSPIAGIGVFAAADIEEGEIVTCYPGDAVTYLPRGMTKSQGTRGVIWGLHVVEDLRTLTPKMDDYAIKVDETYGMVGLRALDRQMEYVGHLVNDASKLSNFESAADYMAASVERANAGHLCFEGSHAACIAQRNIAKGEEILVTCARSLFSQFKPLV